MIHLHLDTDIGSEMTDAAALTLAAIYQDIKLVGVSTVTDDTQFRAQAALKLLSLLGKDKTPVSPGIGVPTNNFSWEGAVFGLENYRRFPVDNQSAAHLIIELANKYNGQLVLAGIGTLSNVAEALRLDKTLPQKVKRLVVMGGMINPPIVDSVQVPRGFEHNFCNDSAAASLVLNAGFNLTIVPGDLTFRADDPWTDSEIEELESINHPAVKLLAALNKESMKSMRSGLQSAGLPTAFARPWANDEILMAYIMQPGLFKTNTKNYRLELPDKYPRFVEDPSGFETTIVTDATLKEVRRYILDRLKEI
ncbi:MAG TPA: nucleoside hydrolase [Candidatus Saccharimonadales bacterium]|nr:nucleoside hydrolase [Candidatus Saccharimonadales bacterium]